MKFQRFKAFLLPTFWTVLTAFFVLNGNTTNLGPWTWDNVLTTVIIVWPIALVAYTSAKQTVALASSPNRAWVASGWTDSKIEKSIAMLWSIFWALLWLNDAPSWLVWLVGIKAIHDHLIAIYYAYKEG